MKRQLRKICKTNLDDFFLSKRRRVAARGRDAQRRWDATLGELAVTENRRFRERGKSRILCHRRDSKINFFRFFPQEPPSSDSFYDSDNEGGSDHTTVERPGKGAIHQLRHDDDDSGADERQRHDSAEVDGKDVNFYFYYDQKINFLFCNDFLAVYLFCMKIKLFKMI